MLRLSNVVARYGSIEALHGVSLEVGPNRVVALLGGNGAGKTTTMHAIAGLLPLRAGTIEFKEQRIDGLPPHSVVKRGIALVSQNRDLFAEMTVAENLELGALRLRPVETKNERLEQQLTLFPRLRERYRQRAGTLSGGERAMLAIARALMVAPALLLLDEPTSGLAPLIVAEVGRSLKSLNEQGQTILLVEQNVRMAMRIAQTVYVLRNGSIVLTAPASEVDEHELTRSYLA
jgi:branched-chain amino acid transport system ATP-binding protein